LSVFKQVRTFVAHRGGTKKYPAPESVALVWPLAAEYKVHRTHMHRRYKLSYIPMRLARWIACLCNNELHAHELVWTTITDYMDLNKA
jgi:hypothetical protein